MKFRYLTLAIMSLAALHATAEAGSSSAPSKVQMQSLQKVDALVHEVAAAYQANDYAKYFSYFDDDIMIWNGPNARWVKQDYVSRWSKVIEAKGGVSSLSIDDLQMRASPSGDSVVATFVMPVVSRKDGVAAGANPTVIYHMTEIWMQRNGNWSMSHMHWSARNPAS